MDENDAYTSENWWTKTGFLQAKNAPVLAPQKIRICHFLAE